MNDKRQGSEKAFKTDENAEISCKIDDIGPAEPASDPGVLQNNLVVRPDIIVVDQFSLSLEAMRQFVHAERKKHGALTAIGHRYSNLLQQIDWYWLAEADWHRENLKRFIARSVLEIRDLKRGVRQLRSPETLLLEFMPGTAH